MKRVFELMMNLKENVTSKAMKCLQDTILAANTETGHNLDVNMFQTLEDVSRLVSEQQGLLPYRISTTYSSSIIGVFIWVILFRILFG